MITKETFALETMVTETPAPELRALEGDERYGRFALEPLEPGFGTTLGNSMRRILLSYLEGAAVTAIFIEGVNHEFTSIPYVKEDVTELVLNMKRINVKTHTAEPLKAFLEVTGVREVHASDIEVPSQVEIANPDLYLCGLTDKKGRLRIEFTIERGKGYVPAERNKRDGQAIGVIPIDAIFSPVYKANFVVEKTRVGQATDYDRLILELWTDGTITPREALTQAAGIMASHLTLFTGDEPPVSMVAGGSRAAASREPEVSVESLDLSVRALNCLKANDISSVAQLKGMRPEELLSLRNFGRKSLDEIHDRLIERGYATAEELGDWSAIK